MRAKKSGLKACKWKGGKSNPQKAEETLRTMLKKRKGGREHSLQETGYNNTYRL